MSTKNTATPARTHASGCRARQKNATRERALNAPVHGWGGAECRLCSRASSTDTADTRSLRCPGTVHGHPVHHSQVHVSILWLSSETLSTKASVHGGTAQRLL